MFSLESKELCLAAAEFGCGECSRVKVGRRQSIHFRVKFVDFFAQFRTRFIGDLVASCLFTFQLLDHPVRPVIWHGCVDQGVGDLLRHQFFSRVRLRTVKDNPFGAPQIVVALLRFARDRTTAAGAAHHAAIDVGLEPHGVRLAPSLHDFLNLVEQGFGDEWFVSAFVQLAVQFEDAVVEGVLQEVLVTREGHNVVVDAAKTGGVHYFAKLDKRVFAAGIQLKRLLDERSFHWIGDDRPGNRIIQVPQRRFPRPDAFGCFLPLTSADVHRQAVGVILALAECEVEHQLSLGRRLKPERAELEIADLPLINQVDDIAAVEGVASQSIRMPGDDAIGFANFNSSKHVVEVRPAFGHRALRFLETANDFQMFFGDELANLSELVVNAASLAFLATSRFTNVDEIASDVFVHGRFSALLVDRSTFWYCSAIASRCVGVASSQWAMSASSTVRGLRR